MTLPPRPSEDPGPPQWSAEDLRIASARGDFAAVDAARQAGQLADLLTHGVDPDRAYDHSGGQNSRVGGRMTPAQAEALLAHTASVEAARTAQNGATA